MVSYLTIARYCRQLIPDCLLAALLDPPPGNYYIQPQISVPQFCPPVTRNVQETHPGFFGGISPVSTPFAAGRIWGSMEAKKLNHHHQVGGACISDRRLVEEESLIRSRLAARGSGA